MIEQKQKISGNLSIKQPLNGDLNNSVIYVEPITQEKVVTPTREAQEIVPDKGFTGLSKVKVKGYTVNTANKVITKNGNYNALDDGLDGYKEVKINVGKYAPKFISFYLYKGTELNEELSNIDTSKVTSMQNMFSNCSKLTNLDLSNFNTSNVTDMSNMFQNCGSLTNLDLSSFDTSKVTTMQNMFNYCSKLSSVDLTNFDTSNVINMSNMFISCTSLTNLDLSSFDTSKVTAMYAMFRYCSRLTSLDLSSFDTSSVTTMEQMFSYNYSLTDLQQIDADGAVNVSGMFDVSRKINNFGGLKNLGKAYLTTQSANYRNYKLDLSSCTLLAEQSLINVLNNLYDIKTKGCNVQQIVLGSANLAKLTSEAGQAALTSANEKGWTVS